jgi:hypothetical protein
MKVFLYDSVTEYKFDDTEDNGDTDLETAIEEFYELSEDEGSYFGFVTTDRIIKFYYGTYNNLFINILDKDNQQNFDKRQIDYDDCIEIIKSVFTNVSIKEIIDNKITK